MNLHEKQRTIQQLTFTERYFKNSVTLSKLAELHTGKLVCYAEDLRRGACDVRQLLAYFKGLLSHWRRLARRKSEDL